MARRFLKRDTSSILAAAESWIQTCLIEDRSILASEPRWMVSSIDEVFEAFVKHPDVGEDDFMTKLTGQMKNASPPAQQLMAEMLWALLLFPSNMKPRTKRGQISDIWALSGKQIPENHPLLSDQVLVGIGSGGPGFNNYRPNELEYLIYLVRDLKKKEDSERLKVFADYDAFFAWIDSVPRQGSRQFRHMLRFFAFPDRVERISSNNDRRKILKAFGVGNSRELGNWGDRQLDEKLLALRTRLERDIPSTVLDFYEPPLNQRWSGDKIIKTVDGDVSVTIPTDEDELEENESLEGAAKAPEARHSIQIQAKLARIGSTMGFKIWIPSSDRGRVSELLQPNERSFLLPDLRLNLDDATLYTIKQIDVLWLKGNAIYRAFEVEQTTAVYSGLLRMADLLALQPNIRICLHIVASGDRRDKVFIEMKRPVFSILRLAPLSRLCTFLSFESVEAINNLQHLAYMDDRIIEDYEESTEEGASS